jgi:hypothetical protein
VCRGYVGYVAAHDRVRRYGVHWREDLRLHQAKPDDPSKPLGEEAWGEENIDVEANLSPQEKAEQDSARAEAEAEAARAEAAAATLEAAADAQDQARGVDVRNMDGGAADEGRREEVREGGDEAEVEGDAGENNDSSPRGSRSRKKGSFFARKDTNADLPRQIALTKAWNVSEASCMWRQTGRCSPSGLREPEYDRDCLFPNPTDVRSRASPSLPLIPSLPPAACRSTRSTDIALLGAPQTSGYCECEDGVHVAPSACQHKSFTCGFKCLGCTNATVYRISQMGDDGCSAVGLQPVQLVEGANQIPSEVLLFHAHGPRRTSARVLCLRRVGHASFKMLSKPVLYTACWRMSHSTGRKPSRRKLRNKRRSLV